MAKRVALVTGASSGIGKETVSELIGDGFTVYAAARRVDRIEPLRRVGALPMSLDVTDEASLVAGVARIKAEAGRLDVLVNNAGYGSYGALEDVPLDEARRQFEVNVFGVARLTQLILPMMRAQRSGRIVNISSVAGKIWEPFGGWYHASKFAIEGMSDCLRVEVAPFGIEVILIQPGPIRTEWNAIAADGLVKTSGRSAYGASARKYAAVALKKGYERNSVSPPAVVARAIGKAVAAHKPKTRYLIGGGAGMILLMKNMLSDRMFDKIVSAQAKP